MAVDWGIQPSEFWRMPPRLFWHLFEYRLGIAKARSDEPDWDYLYSLID